jgi:hypothetical protein
MGKRKLNGTCFYQCEWTGFPMKTAFCYMPTWLPNGKLIKKGSYCNWESVVAHTAWMHEKGIITTEERQKISEHIEFVTGVAVAPAPHYDELSHVRGNMDLHTFHAVCSKQTGPINAVKIAPNGDVFEVLLYPNALGRYDFDSYVHKPYCTLTGLASFHSMRKKGASKGTDRDLTVWYYPTRDLPHNPTASSLFKMLLYGDVLLVQQSREQCFLPRERYVGFNKAQFDEQFVKKRKRSNADPPSLSPEAYDKLKLQMQATLNQYEEKVAEGALAPKELSKVQTSAPMSGRRLAEKLKDRGIPPPSDPIPAQ